MESKEDTLKRIARYLILHSSFTSNIGLMYGKMGIAIFFFHYYRHTGNRLYENFAGELIDEIYEDIHLDYPRDFKNGLAGIAWGMEYLIRHKFVDADADDVLEELDKKILERDVNRVDDLSLETGLKGLAYYIISRCGNKKYLNPLIGQKYICDLIKALNREKPEDDETSFLTKQLTDILGGKEITQTDNLLLKIAGTGKFNNKKLFESPHPIGIAEKGYSGIGLALLQQK